MLMIVGLALPESAGAAWRHAEGPNVDHDLGTASGTPIKPDDPTPRSLAYSSADRPAWLARVSDLLAAARPHNLVLKQYMLFRRGDRPSFLAVVWAAKTYWLSRLELFRIDAVKGPSVRMHFVRQYESHYVDIVEPSGLDVDDDGIAKLFVVIGTYASGFEESHLAVIQLKRSSIDVSPGGPVRPVQFEDLTGRGDDALVASDDRWGHYFSTCGQCGPLIPTIFRWHRGRYEPACRSMPQYFVEDDRLLREFLAKYPSTTSYDDVEVMVMQVFSLAQRGQVDKARREFDRSIAEFRKAKPAKPGDPDKMALIDEAVRDFGPAIDFAVAHRHLPCPILGYPGRGASPGADERTEHFRFEQEAP